MANSIDRLPSAFAFGHRAGRLPLLDLSFSPDLCDEAASEIDEFLEALSFAFEEHYFAQIRRHRKAINPKRSELTDQPWEEDPFPFSHTATHPVGRFL